MQLDEFYTVRDDGNCWTLEYKKEGKLNNKGVPMISRDSSYHANLKQACIAYMHKTLSGAEDVQTVIDRIELAEKRIEKMTAKREVAQ